MRRLIAASFTLLCAVATVTGAQQTQVERGESLGDVMTRADRALRQAKIAGKNRVVVANLPATQSI